MIFASALLLHRITLVNMSYKWFVIYLDQVSPCFALYYRDNVLLQVLGQHFRQNLRGITLDSCERRIEYHTDEFRGILDKISGEKKKGKNRKNNSDLDIDRFW